MARALGLRNRDSGIRRVGGSEKGKKPREKEEKKEKKTSRLIRNTVEIGKTFARRQRATRWSCEAALPSLGCHGNIGQHDCECVFAKTHTIRTIGMMELFFFCLIFAFRKPQAETNRNASSSFSVTGGLGAVAKTLMWFLSKTGRNLNLSLTLLTIAPDVHVP